MKKKTLAMKEDYCLCVLPLSLLSSLGLMSLLKKHGHEIEGMCNIGGKPTHLGNINTDEPRLLAAFKAYNK